MAADDSFSRTIFFIASIIVAVAIAGVIISISGSMAEEVRVRADNIVSEMGTSAIFINDPRYVPYDGENITLYIKNIGDIAYYPENIILFIDGEYVPYDVKKIEGDNRTWPPGSIIEIDATIALDAGDHSAKIVLASGISDTMDFRL